MTLAQKAAKANPSFPQATSLAAAALDRYLWSTNAPQIYGTQVRQEKDGRWTFEPFDPKGITDEQRAAAGVLSVAAARKRIEIMNTEGIQ